VRLIVDWGEIFFSTTRAAVYSSDKKVAEVIKKGIRKVFFFHQVRVKIEGKSDVLLLWFEKVSLKKLRFKRKLKKEDFESKP
jgi:hypothetical protein